ncbi:hypothetical protein BST81_10910 [Leptolyngbya sp. 'hensonii']|uniref:GlcG/HbpS family heme-binding protein n=1 Tax=Leptolyngbya sp. 'hensonii' TaxID=1922337 RepID=UPI00094FAD97|nr:heme-binding protein [Leptolyngbya sp. 'hensonii']OLP18385.1 hypothetical protein BST81_10910 [Leptolyngbya sp. 'hensonii']
MVTTHITTTSRSVDLITASTAVEAARAALTEGENRGLAMSISVFNALMIEVAYIHGDGATPHSAETCRRKAQTAASTRRATGWMNADLAITLPMASGNLLTNVGGGFPIRFNGVFVGAIGVAGGTVEQDIEVSRAALRAIGADAIE